MGTGYDLEADKEYNYENSISMKIELGKTCFSPGENVKGAIILEPKVGNTLQYLQNPNAFLSITENALYTYSVQEYNPRTQSKHYVTKSAKENIPILNFPLDFSYYHNSNINGQLKLPFSFQIPLRIYPSCFFDSNTYIKHYLSIEFPSISAKKTLIIVIKNPPYFSIYNHLYQSPAICYREMKKSKLIFSQGSFIASLKIPKNTFSYEEVIPFEIYIDLSQLAMDIKYIRISLIRNSHKNYQNNHTQSFRKETNEIAYKNLFVNKQQRIITIKDEIEINADKNPKNTYYKLDNDNRKTSQKFSGIYIYPTCFGGLLSVEYFIKMSIIMDTFWTTNEEFQIPIDLYEPLDNGPNIKLIDNTYQNITSPQFMPYPQYPIQGPKINTQVYPQQIPQNIPIQPLNQPQENDQDNLPSEEELNNKNPEEDDAAPPSVMNLINNNNNQ